MMRVAEAKAEGTPVTNDGRYSNSKGKRHRRLTGWPKSEPIQGGHKSEDLLLDCSNCYQSPADSLIIDTGAFCTGRM